MTSIGKRGSETKAGVPGQEVLWLAASEPLPQLITFLRSRGLDLVTRAEVRGPAPLRLLKIEANSSPVARAPNLNGRRIAVMHPDPGNADALAQSLRAKGAEVVALSLNPDSLQRAETLDPDAVIMEASDFSGSCWEIVRAIWQHPHLRFATVILATPELMGNQSVSSLDVQDLSFAVTEVAKEYERVCDDARQLERFSFALESLGPSRSLRALLASGRRLRALISAHEASFEVDLAEQIIVGAQSPAGAAPGEGLLGVHALNLLLSQRAGRVDVRCVDHPAHTNVMAPLDTAMHLARDASSSVRVSGFSRAVALNRAAAPEPAPVVEARPATRPPSVEARPATREPNVEASVPAREPNKEKPLARHNRTLIGVPAVQVDESLLNGKASQPSEASGPPAQPAPPAQPKAPASVATRSFKPPPPRPSTHPPALEKRSLSPAAPAKAPADRPPTTKAYAPTMPALPPPPVPSAPASVPNQAAQVAAAPSPAAWRAEPSAEPSVVVDLPTSDVLAPESPARPLPASALDTIRLDAVDADAVRAFRPQLKVRVPKHARWFAIGAVVLVALALLLTQRRAPQGGAGSVELAATAPALMPHARAAELPAKPSEPAPPAEPAAPPDEVASARELMHGEAAEAPVGHANRANARKASLLSNQGNAFRRKKMLPSARVRYLEALRVYPDYPRALSGLVQLALNGGDKGEALRYAKQLVKARPGQAVYQLLLGDAYRATGDEKEARKSYQSAAQLGSKDAEARLAK